MKSTSNSSRNLAKILPQLSIGLAVIFIPLLLAIALKNTRAASSDQIQSAGTLTTPRANHTATVLSDGRVLIAGGIDANGVSATAEIFDPATKEFTAVGNMSVMRAGHTATLLADGRVLIVGGFDGMGSLQSAEVFNHTNLLFEVVPDLSTARYGHAAARLADGRVLIAGGDTGGTAEIFDPANNTFSVVTNTLAEPRAGHTATLLTNELVFLAGGTTNTIVGNNNVGAELFNPLDQSFSLTTYGLSAPRIGHLAILDADGNVLLIGGDTDNTIERYLTAGSLQTLGPLATPSSSATLLANQRVLIIGTNGVSLFRPGAENPWETVTNAAPLVRSGHTATEVGPDKKVLVAGGVNGANELIAEAALFNPAKVVTDQDDYSPGDFVFLYGSGWKPGENVDIYVVDSSVTEPEWYYDVSIQADANGNFIAEPYLFEVLLEHLGVTFDLTAIGTDSGLNAKVEFTDTVNSVGVSFPANGGSYNSSTYTSGGGNINGTVQWSSGSTDVGRGVSVSILRNSPSPSRYWDGSGFNSVSEVFNTASGSFNGNGTKSWSYAFALPADGNYTVRAKATQNGAADLLSSANTFTIDSTAPTFNNVSGPGNGSYNAGDNLDFTANYNENVTVNTGGGTPRIVLTIGAASRNALYVSGSGTTALVFRYTIVAGDTDTDGIVSTSPIQLNGGTMRDAAGNDAALVFTPPNTTAVLVDTTVPTVTVNQASGQTDPTNGVPVHFTVSFSEAVSGFTSGDVTLTGTATGKSVTFVTDSGDSMTFDVAVTATGGGTIIATVAANGATDTAGNGNTASTSTDNTITFDNTPPTVLISAPSATATTNGPVTYTVTYSGANSVTLSSGDVTLNVTGSANATIGVSGTGTTTRTVTLSSISGDGTLGISIAAGTATDAAGNSAPAAGPSATFVVDNTAPLAPSTPDLTAGSDTGALATDDITSDTTPTFTGTAEAGTTVRIFDGVTQVASGTAAAYASPGLTTSALSQGLHSITATATDGAGNVSVASGALSIMIDTTAPPTPSVPDLDPASDTGSSNTDNITSDNTPTFNGTEAEDGVTVEILNGATSVGSTIVAGGVYSITTSVLTSGTKTITARATDVAGNIATSGSLSVTIDTTAEAAPSTPNLTTDTGSSSTDNVTSVNTPTFTVGSVNSGNTVTIFDGTNVVGSVVASSTTATITTSTLSDGMHSITAKETDVAGNVSPASGALSVTIDTSAPAAPTTPVLTAASDLGCSNTDNLTSDTTPTFTGAAEAGSTVTILDSATAVATGTAAAYGGAGLTTSALSAGTHSISAMATDLAGNVSPASGAVSATILATITAVDVGDGEAVSESAGTTSLGQAATVAAGNTIFVAIAVDPTTSNITVSDTAGNTYTKDADVTKTGDVRMLLFSAPVTNALNSGTITVNFPATTPVAKAVKFFSVPDLVTPLLADKTATNTGTSDSPSVGPTGMTTQPDELVVAIFGYEEDVNFTGGSGYTAFGRIRSDNNGTSSVSVAAEYKTVSATGTQSADGSLSGNTSADWAAAIVTYKIKTASVISINRADANPTSASSVDFTVTFSDAVFGVDSTDFTLATSGVAGASITGVSGSGTTYTVIVNTGTGSGTIGLNLVDDDNCKILDLYGIPLKGTGTTGNQDGSFTGQVYDIDKTGPTVTINQASGQSDPTSTSPIHFTVLFSESVSDFGTGDVTLTGTAGATTAIVTGSGTNYDVVVSGMTGNGTVIATVAAGVAHDGVGNANAASTSTDNTVTFSTCTPPTITCPGAITTNTTGNCSQTVSFAASATGSPTPTITYTTNGTVITSPNTFPVGTTTVTATATNTCGTNACTFTVTVNDTTPPAITCPNAVSVQCFSAVPAPATNTAAFLALTGAAASDNCGSVTVSFVSDSASNGSSSCSNVITRTYRATDPSGNTNDCQQTIAVNDTTPPVITCPVATPPTLISVSPPQVGNGLFLTDLGTYLDSATNTITLSGFPPVTGAQALTRNPVNGLYYAIVSFSVASPPDTTRRLVTIDVDTGVATDVGLLGDAFSSLTFAPNGDLFGVTGETTSVLTNETLYQINTTNASPTFIRKLGAGDRGEVICFNPDDNHIYHWSGFLATRVFEKINMSGPPYTITVIPTTSGNEIMGAVYRGGGVFLTGDSGSIYQNWTTTGSVTNVGVSPDDRRGYAIEGGGSTNFQCAADLPAHATDFASFVTAGGTASDNCAGAVTVAWVSDVVSASNCVSHFTLTRTYRATDPCGNTNDCQQTFTVHDTTAPVITCTSNAVFECDGSGNTAQIAAWLASVTATDACSGTAVVTNNYSGLSDQCGATGSATVTFTATDACSNQTSCVRTVTVVDTTAPTAACTNFTAVLDASGSVKVFAANINNGSSDNCGPVVLAIAKGASPLPSSFTNYVKYTCTDVGTNIATLQVQDACSNKMTCTAMVIVKDTNAPSIACTNATVQLDASGMASVTPAQLIQSASDNCGIASTNVSQSTFGCANLGTNAVTLTVVDVNGNTNKCYPKVIVIERPTTLIYQGPTNAFFASCVSVKAFLKDNLSDNGVPGKTVTFTIGSSSTNAVTDANGIAMAGLMLSTNNLPGNYTVTATFAGMCPFLASSDSDPFTINPGNAGPLAGKACYTGNLFFWTTSTNSGTATLALSAVIRDTNDVCNSDIRFARVTFAIRTTGTNYTPINGAMNLPVGLVDPNNKSVGTANAIVQHNIGSLTADQFQIAVIVTGAYTFNNFNDDRIITVAKPLPGGLIAGGGEVANSDGAGGNDSNGYLQGETNGMYNTLFGLDVEFNKSLKNPQGKVWGKFFSYRKPDGTMDTVLHTYEFKSTAIAVLSLTTTNSATTTNNLASFSSKANLTDTTNPANPVGIEGGDQLQIDLLDGNVEGGAGDQIAITLYRKLSGVWYTIKWNGSKTVKKDIANGDIVVRPAY